MNDPSLNRNHAYRNGASRHASIQRVRDVVYKPIREESARAGHERAALARHLVAQGVATPRLTYEPRRHRFRMPFIDGVSGRSFVLSVLQNLRLPSGRIDSVEILIDALTPLAPLHQVRLHDLDIERFDPWRRIHPRLARSTQCGLPLLGQEIAATIRELASAFVVTSRAPSAETLVHGDFHAGQLIRENNAQVWIVDLDDVAVGPSEVDLGNFAAHLATHPLTRFSPIEAGYRCWADRVCSAYEQLTGVTVTWPLLNLYGSIALLRRALKLWSKKPEPRLFYDIAIAARRVTVASN